ncbi:hypothetical protein BEWA_008160 [Theileria equi strain WA]|uniref:Uncharacterized protein n=1 Tax=Theileria equi strain WA TaxID=1537102 RepID=L0B2H2_THEEQ|nr:hypothetical protein BEWA_008160 [Theileria equi strain WA]AFZ81406.1 hypothetical protein BEWA_008160 [Theileria equi strain WA]|eukprot:XP_004831072.1 hypothetical protein BEWA_008160 [Theileria equi strain WA]
MVKLSRILKKSIVKSNTGPAKVDNVPFASIESFASKGKIQPTIDFSNLDVPNDEIINLKNSSHFDDIEKKRTKIKVIKKNRIISKVGSNKTDTSMVSPKIKEKIRGKVLGRNENTQKQVKVTKPLFSATGEEQVTKKKASDVKVKKTLNKVLSRGKRKREERKESWRRKHTFEAEAKKVIESYKKEDMYGKALGNFVDIQSQLDLVNKSKGSDNKTGPSKNKNTKHTRKIGRMDRKLLQLATTGV